MIVAAASAHAVSITLVLTAGGGSLCGYGDPNPQPFLLVTPVTTLPANCQWLLKPVGDNYYLYNTGLDKYLTLLGNPAKGVGFTLKPQLSGASAVNLQLFNFSSQTNSGGVAIRPATNLDLNINMDGNDSGARGLMLTTWDQDRRSMSWQFTMMDPAATAPTATLAKAPFTVGTYGLLVDQSARPTAGSPQPGMALCADTGDSNVQLQVLSPALNLYCLWQQGKPDGTPSNMTYLYNPATGKVLDINGSGPLKDPTPVNLQPFYTNPLQTYEWWNPTTTDAGYTAFRPSGNSDLNLNGYTAAPVQPAAVTSWSTGSTQPQMSWTFIPVR
ncbi:RICIN domain-containing protein [Streptomyces sp. NPDC008092]|uniref:RICIN domain-containing protein n=1 Tax=Streptomyces sp. NPDC008092 TaxID=3364808 RepID=UPI0036E89AAE